MMNDDLEELEEKISKAKHKHDEPADSSANNKSEGMQTASEFLSYVIAGIFIGFMMDKYLGTAPWGIIALPVLGLAAGVLRANQAMNKK